MLRLSLASLCAHRLRLLRTCLAVVLGVAFLSGTQVLGDTLDANFTTLFSDVSAGTDVVVRNGTTVNPESTLDGSRGLVDEALLDTVRAVPGVAHAEAQVVGYGSLIGTDGDPIGGNGPPRQAGSWITSADLNPYRLVDGRAPVAPDEVVVNRGAARAGGLHVGDTTTVQTPDPVTVHVVGIATFGDADGFGQATFTAFALPAAQAAVTHQPGKVSTILVKAAPGTSSGELRDRIAAALPAGAEAITGQQLADERVDAVTGAFLGRLETFLTGFAVVALFVAGLTIANTFSITLAQRTRELALLRAVGATRSQIRRVVTTEAVVVGAVAAAAGAGAGLAVAGLLKGVFDAFGGALPAGGLVVTPRSVLISVAAGIAVTVAAAQLPARHAAKVPPVVALAGRLAGRARPGRSRLLAGLALLAAGLGVALVAAGQGTAALVLPAGAALVAATLVLAPLALPAAARAIGWPLRAVRGASARMAQQNARRDPRRSAATATALVVGVSVVTLFTVFATSLETALGREVDDGFRADLAVNTAVFGGSRLSPRLTGELRDLPGIARAVAVGGGPALVDGHSTQLTATDPGAIGSVVAVDTVEGSLATLGTDGLAVSATTAHDHGWRVGTPVQVTFADGAATRLTVRAVYGDNRLLGGALVADELWTAHTAQPTNRTVFLTTGNWVSTADARRVVTPVATRYGGDVQDRNEYASATTRGLDLLLGLVYVLLALAVVIALVGIANALSLAVHERRREIGLLRAVGQTRRQARAVLRLEAVIVATFGTLTGLLLGSVLGWTLFEAVSDSPGFTLPVGRLAIVAVLGAAAGALAARRPARRAARLPVIEAITVA